MLTHTHLTHATYTHANTHAHTLAALQSVFPQTELGTFMALSKLDKLGEAAEGADQHCHRHPPL